MNLKSVKTAADLPYKGIELVRVDKNITEVIIGGKLRIKSGNSYSNTLEVLVERPFDTAQRHRVTATIAGFDPKVSYFDQRYEADRAKDDFEAKGATVTIDLADVLVNEDGDVIDQPATASVTAEAADADTIPF